MFRAGLTGTNWVGKTETIGTFVEAHPDLSVETVSLWAIVERCPLPTIGNQTVEASGWIANEVRTACDGAAGAVQLFDRTPVDILAFTLYAEQHTGQGGQEVLNQILGLLECFDTIFYVPISEAWPTGVSPTAEEVDFARLMDSYVRRAIDRFALEVISMPWDLDARQELLCQYVPTVGSGGRDDS